MAKVTIAKALNVKNRLVGEKARIFSLLQANNSRLETQKSNYKAEELFAQWEKAVNDLIAVKTAVAKANVSIYEKIYRISELKSKAANLRSVNTDESDHEERKYNHKTDEHEVTKTIKRVVFLKDNDVDEKVKAIEKEIEKLHDEITAFNYSQEVEIPE